MPALLERARRRAEAEGLEAEFVEGDAEAPRGTVRTDLPASPAARAARMVDLREMTLAGVNQRS